MKKCVSKKNTVKDLVQKTDQNFTEKQLKKERNKNYVNCIMYDHDACGIWKNVWFCFEGNVGDHKNYFLYCVASHIFNCSCIYGIDVDRTAGSDRDRTDLIFYM